MIHPIHEKWAALLTEYCTTVTKGENVLLFVETSALPMARALTRKVLELGAYPILRMIYPEYEEDLYELAQEHHFEGSPSFELSEIKQIHSWIRIRGPENTKALQNADKKKIAAHMKWFRDVQNIRINETRWVGTLYPTNALAQDADMSLSEYEHFVYSSMYLFDDDPVAKWQEVHNFQAKLIDRLKVADEVHLKGEGTDLKMRVKDRVWVNSDGHKNMPSGEVFTGPIEDSVNGFITYQIPSSVRGIEVENVQLTFEDGKVVAANADKGNDFLQAQLNTDNGARFLGELGIGTNYNIQQATKQILYDEKIGGTIHLALGQSYPETGGVNESAIHWDMICDLRKGGAIYLDGELFQEKGQFKI